MHTLTLKQPSSEIENKCDKTEMEKREGNQGASSRYKNSLEGDKKQARETEPKEKKRNVKLD